MPAPIEGIPSALQPIAIAAANEGIPVCAIARILRHPSDEVYDVLRDAAAMGSIAELPKADWPPTAKMADRVPTVTTSMDISDLGFLCRQVFKLTPLEGAFLAALVKADRMEKTKLHNIVEHQRSHRLTQPANRETTDIKMVDVVICKIRKKMADRDPGLLITTIVGGGYYVVPAVKTMILDLLKDVPYGRPDPK